MATDLIVQQLLQKMPVPKEKGKYKFVGQGEGWDMNPVIPENKQISVWGLTDCWRIEFYQNTGEFFVFSDVKRGKELGMMKRIVQDFGTEDTQKIIRYFLENYRKMAFFKGLPTFEFLYSCRKSLLEYANGKALPKTIASVQYGRNDAELVEVNWND